ncbi:hypothetical protein [Paraburkholderia sp. RAU2J]|uniref:hypothetical protein n=1 Tax=Paraburkholderia sp. RAU2J TaxID=1938810 RepID=UPI0011C3DADC|nr:hypothetical protein [Paraburkholderia sp. RAU2J]
MMRADAPPWGYFWRLQIVAERFCSLSIVVGHLLRIAFIQFDDAPFEPQLVGKYHRRLLASKYPIDVFFYAQRLWPVELSAIFNSASNARFWPTAVRRGRQRPTRCSRPEPPEAVTCGSLS